MCENKDTCDHNVNILETTAAIMASTKDFQRTNDEVESLLQAALNSKTNKLMSVSVFFCSHSCSMLT